MGGGLSNLQRARKMLVIRAYNQRGRDETVSEQFEKLSFTNTEGVRVLAVGDIKQLVGITQPWFDELLTRIADGTALGEVPTASFVDFLETGQLSLPSPPDKPKTRPSSGGKTSDDFARTQLPPPESKPAAYGSSLFDLWGDAPAVARRFVKTTRASADDPVYPDVMTCLGFRAPTACRAVVPHAGSTLSLNAKDSYRKPGPTRPLWRKRETVVHERIVQYTTVDADGTVQELVESERSQNEVVHLECKDTGEFAHRESLEIEQMETFNNEVVVEERGNEQYIHLKSKEDEFEHLESNMPARKAKTEEEAAAEAEAAAAAEAAAHAQAAAAATEAAAASMPHPEFPHPAAAGDHLFHADGIPPQEPMPMPVPMMPGDHEDGLPPDMWQNVHGPQLAPPGGPSWDVAPGLGHVPGMTPDCFSPATMSGGAEPAPPGVGSHPGFPDPDHQAQREGQLRFKGQLDADEAKHADAAWFNPEAGYPGGAPLPVPDPHLGDAPR